MPRTASKDARIVAVRSWAREARHLVDAGRRSTGGRAYANSMAGIDILGREGEKAKTSQEKGEDSPRREASRETTKGDADLAEKDKRLVKLDLERIQEAERRMGEILLEGRLSSQDGTPSLPKMAVNPACERAWAVVLYNTGIVELVRSLFLPMVAAR